MRQSAGRVAVLVLSSVAALGGCRSGNYCLKDQNYYGATDQGPLKPVAGLSIPESTSALKIPPAPPSRVPFGVPDEKGDGVCLDRPPPLRNVATSAVPAEDAVPAKDGKPAKPMAKPVPTVPVPPAEPAPAPPPGDPTAPEEPPAPPEPPLPPSGGN